MAYICAAKRYSELLDRWVLAGPDMAYYESTFTQIPRPFSAAKRA